MLRLRNVSRTYAEGQPVHALRDTDLDIAEGDYVTISGPSGSGKSTLLNVLGLLDRPDSGTYAVAGVETTTLGEATRGAVRGQLFGFVFQAFHLLAGRTATENVELGMLYAQRSRRRRRELAADALARVGLAHRAGADPRTLSGGEKQRVAIARAIASRRRVLFCDEPTGNLDSANTERLLDLLAELHGTGLTIVTVTHDPRVAGCGTRQLVVADGLVTERGVVTERAVVR